MKTIIVPINFSSATEDTIKFSLQLANRLGCNVQLFTVVKSESKWYQFWSTPGLNMSKEEIFGKLKELHAKHKPLYKVPKGTFDYDAKDGCEIETTILDTAENMNACFIVLGINDSMESSKHMLPFISNTKVPVIIYKEGYVLERLNSILMPIDNHDDSRQKVPFVCNLAKISGASVKILGCAETEYRSIMHIVDLRAQQVEAHLKENGIACETDFVYGNPIDQTLLKYTELWRPDIIAIMSSLDDEPINLIIGNNAKEFINKMQVPIICIPASN